MAALKWKKKGGKREPAWCTSKICRDKRLPEISIKLMTVFSGKKTTAMEILGDGVVKANGIHLVGRGPRFAHLDLTLKF